MKANLHIERPLAATIMLAAMLGLAGLVLAFVAADLASTLEERDAKADFVMRSLRASRTHAANAGQTPARNLAIVADSETLAAADLDTLVRTTFVDAGGAVTSSQTEAKHDETGLAGRIETRAVAEAPIEGIQKALYGLESGTPLVLVDEISIQPADSSGTADTLAQAPLLRATMTLSAYWAAPAR